MGLLGWSYKCPQQSCLIPHAGYQALVHLHLRPASLHVLLLAHQEGYVSCGTTTWSLSCDAILHIPVLSSFEKGIVVAEIMGIRLYSSSLLCGLCCFLALLQDEVEKWLEGRSINSQARSFQKMNIRNIECNNDFDDHHDVCVRMCIRA